MFQVIPAIDIAESRLAVYAPGGPIPLRAFDGDPLTAARTYVAAGVRWIHVVDMDLAFGTAPANLAVIEEVAALGVRVQASGGVRDAGVVDAMLAAGASRVVLGSAAFPDEDAVQELITIHGERLVLGIEVEDGRIRSRGADPVDLELVGTLGWLAAAGAKRFLVTAVPRVGGLAGPDVGLVKRVVRAGRPVIAAGGISGMQHLEALRVAGATGAVVGRAAMEGGLDLEAARTRFGS